MSTTYMQLRDRIPGCTASDMTLAALLEDASVMCLSYLGRREIPEGLEPAIYRMAVTLYNRMGMEGETGHAEGGVSVTADPMPEEIKTMLRPYRLAGTGR